MLLQTPVAFTLKEIDDARLKRRWADFQSAVDGFRLLQGGE